MPLWVQDQAVHWPDVPHPSQSPRGDLEKLVGGQTEHQAWGDGIPEPEAARQEVGLRGPDGQYFRLFSAVSSDRDQSSELAGTLRLSPAALPQEISV